MKSQKTILFSLLLGFFLILIIFPNNNRNLNFDNENRKVDYDKNEYHQKPSGNWNNFTFIHIQEGNWSDGVPFGWIIGDGTFSNPYKIENMTIDATNSPTGYGIFVNDSSDDYYIIKNCTVTNALGVLDKAGIYILESNNGTIINNTCSNNFKGIFIEDCTNNTIIDNIGNNNTEEGLVAASCSNSIIIGNKIYDNGEGGIDLDFSTELIVKENEIYDNGGDGIEWEMELDDSEEEDFFYTNITENTIINNGDTGIRISSGDPGVDAILNLKWNNISGNIIEENENGIAFELSADTSEIYCSNNTISNNILIDNGDNGISIDGLADKKEVHFSLNNITDNAIIDSGSNGILIKVNSIFDGKTVFSNNDISGNNITSSGDNGIYVDLNTDNNPSFSNTEVNFNYNDLSYNLINISGFSGINLTATMVDYGNIYCNNNSIIVNFLIENGFHGIYLYECTNSTVLGNNMSNCGLGISFHQESSKTIKEITSNNIDITNLVNGNPVHYYVNELNLGPNNFSNPGQVILINCNDSAISNLNILQGSIGIMLHRCNNNTISNNNASDNSIYGISLEVCYNNTLLKNNASYNVLAGIYLYYSYGNNRILNNNASYNKNYGIALYSSNSTKISKNNATYNEHSGIYLFNSYHNNISGCIVNSNLIYGIYLEICNHTLISGNSINENQDKGIYLLNSYNNTISDNTETINDNTNQGIYLENSDFNIISGNIIRFNTIGIYFLDSSNNTIINNDLRGNSLAYLEVGNSEGNKFSNNILDTLISGGGGGGGSGSKSVEGLSEEIITIIIIIIIAIIAAVSIVGSVGVKRYRVQLREKEKEIQVLKIEKANLTEGDIQITKERLLCVVHKGPIKAFTFICPECGTFYCAKCYEVVKKLENACWSCKLALDPSKPVKITDEKGKVIDKIVKAKPGSKKFYPKKAPKDFKPYKEEDT